MYSFCAYLVQINHQKKKLDLGVLKPSGSKKAISIYDVLQLVMDGKAKSGLFQKAGEKKVFRYSNSTAGKDGSVYGMIESGEFGQAQDFVEVQTKKVTYYKKKTEAGLTPFFIRLAPTKNPQSAVLICQKVKNYGVKSELNEALGSALIKCDKDWVLRVEKIVPSQLINRYLNDGEVKNIRLISHEKPSDIAEELSQLADDEKTSVVEMVIRAKRGKNFGQELLGFIKDDKPLTGLLTLPQMQCDEIKADVEIGGKRKTLNLTNMRKIGAMIDITDQVALDAKGHPTLVSLLDISGDLIEDLKKEL